MFCSFNSAVFLRIAAYCRPLCLAVVLLGACGSEPAADTPTPIPPTPVSDPTMPPLSLQELSSYIYDFQEVFIEWHDKASESSRSHPAATDRTTIQAASVQERIESSIQWAEELQMHTQIAQEKWRMIVPPQVAEEAHRTMTDFLDSQNEMANRIIGGLSSARGWTEIELVEFFSELEPKAMEGQQKQWKTLDIHERLADTLRE